MTDRFHSLTVVLAEDTREDDAEAIIQAIHQLRGVVKVTGNVSDVASHMAETRARRVFGEQLWEVLYPKAAA